LAAHTGMSKSGLFRHFGSKEDSRCHAAPGIDRFTEAVVRPALKAPRGLARVRELFDRWLAWESDQGLEGGCLFIAASIELDDQPGVARDYLVATQIEWLGFLESAARKAVEAGDFRPDLDVAQFAHEFNTIFLGFHQAHARCAICRRRPARRQFD
jgi:AcrR family transcriptional regulator